MAYNILVVDDSAITRKMIKRAIHMSGLELGSIHEAGDGLEALRVLDEQWIDLVFADLNMPRLDGVELVGRMAENRLLESTPVIVVTSDRNELRMAELTRRGVRAHLNKPFRPETLRDLMAHVLDESGPGEKDGS